MNFYKHHIGDYDSATAHLSWLEDAAYRRLLSLYYRTEQPIPADIGAACRLVRAASKPEREAVATVLREFFALRDDGWHQQRCDEEISSKQEKTDRNREVGKLGGRPRKIETQTVSEEKPNENPDGFFSEPNDNPSHKPVTREEKRSPSGARLPAGWSPSELLAAWAARERPDLDLDRVVASFRDHWAAKPGAAGRKLDWDATFRNWVRSERPGAGPPPSAGGRSQQVAL